MIEYIYCTFDGQEMDSVTCSVYCNGETIGGGSMERYNKVYKLEFDITKPGSYFALCEGKKGSESYFRTFPFTVYEEPVPELIDVEAIMIKLNTIKEKLGNEDQESLQDLINELTSYETGVSPLPYLKPITALNTNISIFLEANNSMLIDQNGEGLTGGKIVFIDKETGDEYVTYTKLGYWGIYLPVATYDVTLTYEDYTATDSLIVG